MHRVSLTTCNRFKRVFSGPEETEHGSIHFTSILRIVLDMSHDGFTSLRGRPGRDGIFSHQSVAGIPCAGLSFTSMVQERRAPRISEFLFFFKGLFTTHSWGFHSLFVMIIPDLVILSCAARGGRFLPRPSCPNLQTVQGDFYTCEISV